MKKNYTHISIVLDKSSSMEGIRSDTIGGFNRFLKEQQAVPGQATITLDMFSDDLLTLQRRQPLAGAVPLSEGSYQPHGWTALYGAIGHEIEATGHDLEALPETERPEKVIFVIVTDGEENSSHKYEWSRKWTHDKLAEAIARQTKVYNWQFVYIGANQDAILNAMRMGIPADQAINYAANQVGTQSLYRSMASNVASFRVGSNDTVAFSDKQRKEQDDAAKP